MRIVIAYGTETYNSEGLSNDTQDLLKENGFESEVVDLASFEDAALNEADVLLLITSTFGDGEPPSNAEDAYDFFMSDDAPSMQGVQFSVCGLGDTEYEHFCQCAKDFDRRFEALGATRIAPRMDCDTDYDEAWEQWFDSVLEVLKNTEKRKPPRPKVRASLEQKSVSHSDVEDRPSVSLEESTVGGAASVKPSRGVKNKQIGTRKNPYLAKVRSNLNLNHPFSEKETRHIVLELEHPNLTYKVGDALGVFPRNCPDLVRRILDAVQLPREKAVEYDGQWYPLRDLLLYKTDLTQVDRRMLRLASEGRGGGQFLPLLDDRKAANRYLASNHLIDVLTTAECQPDPAAFVAALKPLAPRLYSIASSPNYHENEVHLTVDVLRYELNGSLRKGCASSFLGERAGEGVEVAVYIQPTSDFVLCADEAPIIMIGPGTGIAPFRAFLQEREYRNASGQSWLFFGAQRSGRDFLYRDELMAWKESGRLVRLDTAFSRDQSQKVYVQHRLYEHRKSIYHWLESGAYVYVCGDATRMAKDVNETLLQIIEDEGQCSRGRAESYLKALTQSGRYLRDVY